MSGITTAVGFIPHPAALYISDVVILMYDAIRAESQYQDEQKRKTCPIPK